MQTRGHGSMPKDASRCRMARSPAVTFCILEHPEPASDVVGRVPRHVGERRQGERRNTGSGRPLSGVIKQRPAQPPAGATRIDRQLLDVHTAVDHVGDEKPRRPVISAGNYPQAAFIPASCERLWSPWHPANLGPADLVEHLPCCPVDLLDRGKLSHLARANTHVSVSPPRDRHCTPRTRRADARCTSAPTTRNR